MTSRLLRVHWLRQRRRVYIGDDELRRRIRDLTFARGGFPGTPSNLPECKDSML